VPEELAGGEFTAIRRRSKFIIHHFNDWKS